MKKLTLALMGAAMLSASFVSGAIAEGKTIGVFLENLSGGTLEARRRRHQGDRRSQWRQIYFG